MSDDQQPEDLRPIPDGGLKDAMPGWLKRPPAWRSMPSAEQRHERTLPEPDTSEIDPKTLVDVSDLPQWLQTIAARGEVPVPEPDQTVGHALQQIQAASARSRDSRPEMIEEDVEMKPTETTSEDLATDTEATNQEPVTQGDEANVEQLSENESPGEDSPPMSIGLVIAICVLIVVVIIGAYALV